MMLGEKEDRRRKGWWKDRRMDLGKDDRMIGRWNDEYREGTVWKKWVFYYHDFCAKIGKFFVKP